MAGKLKRPSDSALTQAEWDNLSVPSRRWIVEILALASETLELRARLALNSTNSSKPPSSDPPQVKKPKRKPSGRRPGGQPGHPGHSRALVPLERVDDIQDVYPEQCRRCGFDLPANAEEDLDPLRHQVTEIPPIEPRVTECRRHRGCCPQCGTVTVAPLPEGMPEGSFGPNLRALLVVLSGRFRLSRREVVEFCGEALGLAISVGCVDNMCRGVVDALQRPYEEVQEHIQAASVVHLDESGWRQRGVRHWIWVAVTSFAAFFQLAKSRGSVVARGILGEAFTGAIVSDRWSAYSLIPVERRQVCWAHLKRDFQSYVDRGGAAHAFGEEGLRLTRELFMIWNRFEGGEIGRHWMQLKMADVEMGVGELLAEGVSSSDKKVKGFSKKLLELGLALFLFTRTEGIEPTNNRAERAIRPIVLWRKGSFGTGSEEGSRFVERMMTVVMTCRLQGHSVLGYLRDICKAQDEGRKSPSLLRRRVRDGPRIGETKPCKATRRSAG